MFHKGLSLLIVGILFSPVFAQDQKAAGGKRGARGARGGDPLTSVERLTEMLNLDANQQTQLKQLITEFEQARKAIEDKRPQDLRDKRRDLEQQIRQARKDGDKQKTADLQKQLAELVKSDPQTQELAKIKTQLITEIEKILRDDQKQIFRSKFAAGKGKGQAAGSAAYFVPALSQLQLRPDQKTEVDKLQQQFKADMKALPKDAKGTQRAELTQKFRDEVMKILDEPQKKQLDGLMATMANMPKGPLANPKMLEEAIRSIQLRPDQQTNITALFDRYRTDRQAIPKDKQGAVFELNQKLVNDVMNVLDQAQKDELAKWRPTGHGRGEHKKGAKANKQQ
jgi:hypothetical protein